MAESIEILAHRGLWREASERNTPAALARALDAGLGIETDIRDHNGQLVVSHDPPGDQSWPLSSLLEYYESSGSQAWLAFNIKSDGLAALLSSQLSQFRIHNYFVFDMSVPDARGYLSAGTPWFTRQSEIEPLSVLVDRADGVWLDAFDGDWYDEGLIAGHLAEGRHVAVVSPELHGRRPQAVWDLLERVIAERGSGVHASAPMSMGGVSVRAARLMVCTDLPCEFRERQGI